MKFRKLLKEKHEVSSVLKLLLSGCFILLVLIVFVTCNNHPTNINDPPDGDGDQNPVIVMYTNERIYVTAEADVSNLAAIDLYTGNLISEVNNAPKCQDGMSLDNGTLWMFQLNSFPATTLLQIDPADCRIINQLWSYKITCHGLTFDGSHLITIGHFSQEQAHIFIFDTSTSNVVNVIPLVKDEFPDRSSLCWDGVYLWYRIACDDQEIYKVNITDGSLISTIQVPEVITDLAWDGENLWALISESGHQVVKIDHNNGEILHRTYLDSTYGETYHGIEILH